MKNRWKLGLWGENTLADDTVPWYKRKAILLPYWLKQELGVKDGDKLVITRAPKNGEWSLITGPGDAVGVWAHLCRNGMPRGIVCVDGLKTLLPGCGSLRELRVNIRKEVAV